MTQTLRGKTALITGGTRGLGAAICDLFAEQGARVLRTGTTEQKSASSADFFQVDFSNDKSTESFLSKISSEKIDILINNAGINKIELTSDLNMEDWDRIQKVNVRAPTLLCKMLAPQMASRGWGRIINVSSIFGLVSKSKRVSYSTSKFAIHGLTKAVALDFAAQGVLVNSLSPGFVDTELTRSILSPAEIEALTKTVPMNRLASPKELAVAALFLASPENSFMTGQNLVIDGGFTSV